MNTPDTKPAVDPLAMAMVQARAVYELARPLDEAATEDERIQAAMDSRIAGTGRRQHEAAEMGAHLALIALARDVRRIADHLTGTPDRSQP